MANHCNGNIKDSLPVETVSLIIGKRWRKCFQKWLKAIIVLAVQSLHTLKINTRVSQADKVAWQIKRTVKINDRYCFNGPGKIELSKKQET